MAGRENLRDGGAAVVGDHIDFIEAHRLAEGFERVRLGAQRDVLVRPRRRIAMAEKIGR